MRAFGKKIMATACAVALCATAVVGLSGCSQVQDKLGIVSNTDPAVQLESKLPAGSTIQEGVLTVGINATNSPYGGTNSSGDVIGFDVDVAAALADELGCKVKIVDVSADGKSAIEQGSVDVAMSAVKTGKNDKISYTNAYINDGTSLFCLIKNMPDNVAAADLSKEPVLVQGASAAALEIQDALGIDSIVAAGTMQEAFESLEKGEYTYLVADAVIGDYYSRDYSDIVRVDFLSANNVSPVYAVTAASNAGLSIAVAQALDAIANNGVLRVVAAKWLGSQGSTLLPGALALETLPETFDPKAANKKKTKEKRVIASDAADDDTADGDAGEGNAEEDAE